MADELSSVESLQVEVGALTRELACSQVSASDLLYTQSGALQGLLQHFSTITELTALSHRLAAQDRTVRHSCVVCLCRQQTATWRLRWPQSRRASSGYRPL